MSKFRENDTDVVIRCLNDHMETQINLSNVGVEMDEISIISQHSSIQPENNKYQEIMKTSGNCEFLRGLLFQDQEQDDKITQILRDNDDEESNQVSSEILITHEDGEVNISQSESIDKARKDLFRLKVHTKHRHVMPRFIDNDDENNKTQPESATTTTTTTLDTQTLTQTAALAASIAAMNVVNQPYIKIQTDLEDKLAYVIKQLDNLKRDGGETTQPNSRVNPNYDSEIIQSERRLVNMEKIQSQQVYFLI